MEGCTLMRKVREEVGNTYGRLTILEEVEPYMYPSGEKRRQFLANCSCGSGLRTYRISELRSGNTKSCGCLNLEKISSHSMSTTRIYQCWADMKTRCDNPANKFYKDYGGRGITYCEKWKSFEGFFEDMGDSYSDDLTLNRRDNDGQYCKENCEWDNKNFQGHMRRKQKGTKLESIGTVQYSNSLMFYARIKINEKGITLGTYSTEEDASKAYDDASEIVYGDRPNKTTFHKDEIYNKVLWYLENKEQDIRRIKPASSKLSDEQVLEIVRLYNEGLIQKDIAALFGVGQCTVSSICRGDSWTRITGITKSGKENT